MKSFIKGVILCIEDAHLTVVVEVHLVFQVHSVDSHDMDLVGDMDLVDSRGTEQFEDMVLVDSPLIEAHFSHFFTNNL